MFQIYSAFYKFIRGYSYGSRERERNTALQL